MPNESKIKMNIVHRLIDLRENIQSIGEEEKENQSLNSEIIKIEKEFSESYRMKRTPSN